MNKRDYYTVLELPRACASHDIKQSYRRLALKWHPDKCLDKSEAELKFNEIHEAYTVLSDLSKKQIYDKYGHQGLSNEGFGSSNTNKFFQKGFQGVEKSAFDILNDILKEKEDDYFFQNYDGFGISDNFKSSIKSFIEDNVFQNEPDLSGNSFFETYKPTFMNPGFFTEPSALFGTDFDKCTTSSFLFQTTDTEEKTYSRTSTNASQDGKIADLLNDIVKDTNPIVQREKTGHYDQKLCKNSDSDTQTTDSDEKPKVKRASYILIGETVQDDPLYTYARDAEFYAAFELNRRMTKEAEANSNINTSSKKITKNKESLNIRLVNKKPSKKNKN